jgi:UDP-N-acetylbacillosamine transaminase
MERIFLSPPNMGGMELEYIKEAFGDNYIAPVGSQIDAFEKSLIEYTNAKYAIALSSGTAALHLALRINGISANDKVAASSFTFIGSVSPILYQNATPIFIDSDKDSWNMDPNLFEDACKKYAPKALILTHLYGMSAELKEIVELCDKYNVILIEDAAESLGGFYNNIHTGLFGKCAALSFNGNKIITTSGGGALITNDEHIAKEAKFLSTQARENAPYYEHITYGYNYRMSNVLAAIGVGQMEVLEKRVLKKREIFNWYKELLCEKFMPELPNSRGNRWLTTILFNEKDKNLITYLAGCGDGEPITITKVRCPRLPPTAG